VRDRGKTRAVSAAARPRLDELLAERIQRLIARHPTFGYRRLWALLRFAPRGLRINRAKATPPQAVGYRSRGSSTRYNPNSWLEIGGALQSRTKSRGERSATSPMMALEQAFC